MNSKHLFIVLSFTLSLLGCQNTGLDELDHQVRSMLREQQIRSLGGTDNRDPGVLPPRTADARLQGSDYDRQPATYNPDIKRLPAEAGRQKSALPTGDGTAEKSKPTPRAVHQFGIEKLLAFAIANSPDYRDEKEDLFLASIDLLIEEHLWGPRFFNDVTARFDGTPEGGDRDHAFSLINDLSVTKRLPFGGEVSASALVSFVEQLRNAAGNNAASSQEASLELAATIPLLRGAGKVAQEPRIQAHRDLVYAVRNFERFRRGFLVSVATDYFNLLQEQQQIKNLEGRLASLKKVEALNKALADAGRTPYFEVQEIQLQVLFTYDNLQFRQERYDNSLDALKIRIGMPMSDGLTLEQQTIDAAIPKLDFTESVNVAYKHRLDLQTTFDQIADNRRRVAVARNDTKADLDLDARITLPTDGTKDRAGLDLDAGAGSYRIGVTYGAPLDRKIEHLRHRRALVNLERSERSYTLFRDRITLDVRQSIRQVERSRTSLAIQLKNVELASKRREGVFLRIRSLPIRRLIEAEDDLNDARDDADAAATTLRTAVLEYLLATGQMRVGPEGQWRSPVKLVAVKQ